MFRYRGMQETSSGSAAPHFSADASTRVSSDDAAQQHRRLGVPVRGGTLGMLECVGGKICNGVFPV